MSTFQIPDARQAQDSVAAGNAGDTSISFEKSVIDAMSTSIGNKSRTATVSMSGKTAADIMAVYQELRRKGHGVTLSGSNMTINW